MLKKCFSKPFKDQKLKKIAELSTNVPSINDFINYKFFPIKQNFNYTPIITLFQFATILKGV